MGQEHFDRLSALDAGFLARETGGSHMQIGVVAICEGPAPPQEDLLDAIRGRLHLVPRYRQKLAVPPAETGRPVWVDDPSFFLEYHVRRTALPAPGDEELLMATTARIFSQRLDRSKPLWELWVVEGVEGGRFAIISKTHHALVDGIAALDLAVLLFDATPVPEPPRGDQPEWRPAPEPTALELAAAGVRDAALDSLKLAAGGLYAMSHPSRALSAARDAAEGVGEVAWAMLNPAPATPLNVEIGPHRRFVAVRFALDDFRLIKRTFGGTVNDVVLTVVTAALRCWLQGRGVRTAGLELRALVPVSMRTRKDQGTGGNRLAAMRGPLPVYVADPVERLRTVRQAMQDLKGSKQAVGAEVLAGVQAFVPPNVMAQAARLTFSTRLFNLLVTNIPGPQFPLYVRGRELVDAFPVAFLAEDHALSIAAFSYNGKVNFGLLGDYDAVPDLAVIGRHLEDAVAELVALARERAEEGAAPPERAAATA
jgi:WS/DGAT/MGAT family acyltransferase